MVFAEKEKPRLIVLSGPTGVGKTGLSLELAERFGAEIINCDSMQIYKYMDIGTAKPTYEERARAKHHLVDFVEPDEDFDAAAYLRLARPIIESLDDKGTPVLVVGGAGLYLRSLLQGLFDGPGRDPEIRAAIKAEAAEKGRPAMHEKLARLDPETASRLHPNDLVRIVRALEVYELTGRPISSFQSEHGLADNPYEVLFYCLNLPREQLYERIELRTHEMFDLGWVEEVRDLLDKGYSPELKPLKAIGYKEVVAHIRGRWDRDEAKQEIMKQTRRFAKRQLTWFRKQPEVFWRSPEQGIQILEEASVFLK